MQNYTQAAGAIGVLIDVTRCWKIDAGEIKTGTDVHVFINLHTHIQCAHPPGHPGYRPDWNARDSALNIYRSDHMRG